MMIITLSLLLGVLLFNGIQSAPLPDDATPAAAPVDETTTDVTGVTEGEIPDPEFEVPFHDVKRRDVVVVNNLENRVTGAGKRPAPTTVKRVLPTAQPGAQIQSNPQVVSLAPALVAA
ncbi:hypothetical protein WDU94_007005 [Cyamophila willieti]